MIIEIALGIVLAVIILANLDKILMLSVGLICLLAILAAIGVVVVLAFWVHENYAIDYMGIGATIIVGLGFLGIYGVGLFLSGKTRFSETEAFGVIFLCLLTMLVAAVYGGKVNAPLSIIAPLLVAILFLCICYLYRDPLAFGSSKRINRDEQQNNLKPPSTSNHH